ncbi:AMP-dependent synthetase and ligase [Ferroglobus placidus DSM 10642]|uniref:AMP-dependent synthetase and ligase n=1 Tax=Ferroglobus placidus (strain DSM 10642 / AEDII12DO) TaxID=589924 RepID=D3S0X4_FERPA|nr:long-chain fatty acid--CoA ligase [Ferroglobus placidus]ADC66365.1 AMP-dependent synthetase and ligase [Ferroglobus placidus DSM 10642]
MLGVEGKLITEISEEEINRIWLKHYDKGVRPNLEYPEIPLYDFLDNSAEKFPDKVALDFIGKEITYRQLKEASERIAGYLKSIGVKKGDKIILDLPNTPHYVIAYFGVLKAGGTVVQCNPLYTEREVRHIAENSEAKIAFCIENAYPKLRKLKEEGVLEKIVVCRVEDYLKFPLNILYKFKKEKVELKGDFDFWKDAIRSEPIDRAVKVDPKEDVAVFQYTGGTTGLPKAAMLTHFNLVANVYQVKEWLPDLSEKDVFAGALPYFHVYGMTTSMNTPIALGAKIVLIPDPRDIKRILDSIEKHRITIFCGVPTLFNAINNYPGVEKWDLSSIRACISGAAPLPIEVKREFERITGGKLVEGYGLSETSPVAIVNPVYGLNKEGSIGIPVSDTYAVVIDDEGRILPVGEVGELAIKGPQVMKGYYKMEEETAKALVNGWLLTGDMAKMDEDGYFYIVDRKKDVIIAGGYNIYPREVEEVLYEHPAVLEAAVVGVPDKYRGETVKAFVVLKPEYRGKVTEKEIEQFCRERLAAYKVPKIIEFRDELPKSAVGKILRRVLREESTKGSS